MERAKPAACSRGIIRAFFEDAFAHLGGRCTVARAGPSRTHPGARRRCGTAIGRSARRRPVLRTLRARLLRQGEMPGDPPPAALIAPGHPLLDAVIDVDAGTPRQAAEARRGPDRRAGRGDQAAAAGVSATMPSATGAGRNDGGNLVISQRLQFVVTLRATARRATAGAAPYLDYRPATADERAVLRCLLDAPWLRRDLEEPGAAPTPSSTWCRSTCEEVRAVRLPQIDQGAERRSRLG